MAQEDIAHGDPGTALQSPFDLLVQNLKDYAIILLDSEGIVISWNTGAQRLKGYTTDEIAGKHFSFLYSAEDVKSGKPDRLLNKARTHGRARDEGWRKRKDGSVFWAEVIITALTDSSGRVRGFVKITHDMSDWKNMEDSLRKRAQLLERSNAELAIFAQAASHDLQEPLRKIIAFGDLLKSKHSGALSREGVDYLERMRQGAWRLKKLISDLLALAKVTSEWRPRATVDLNAALGEALADLEIKISQSGAAVSAKALPRFDADPAQMRQLFQNLIDNSLKFRRTSAPPRVVIDGELLKNGSLRITVRDNGIGFNEEEGKRLFKPFQRLHSRAEYPGSGIGLSICERIVTRHGGTISAHGVPDQGAVFTILLPPHGETS